MHPSSKWLPFRVVFAVQPMLQFSVCPRESNTGGFHAHLSIRRWHVIKLIPTIYLGSLRDKRVALQEIVSVTKTYEVIPSRVTRGSFLLLRKRFLALFFLIDLSSISAGKV